MKSVTVVPSKVTGNSSGTAVTSLCEHKSVHNSYFYDHENLTIHSVKFKTDYEILYHVTSFQSQIDYSQSYSEFIWARCTVSYHQLPHMQNPSSLAFLSNGESDSHNSEQYSVDTVYSHSSHLNMYLEDRIRK